MCRNDPLVEIDTIDCRLTELATTLSAEAGNGIPRRRLARTWAARVERARLLVERGRRLAGTPQQRRFRRAVRVLTGTLTAMDRAGTRGQIVPAVGDRLQRVGSDAVTRLTPLLTEP